MLNGTSDFSLINPITMETGLCQKFVLDKFIALRKQAILLSICAFFVINPFKNGLYAQPCPAISCTCNSQLSVGLNPFIDVCKDIKVVFVTNHSFQTLYSENQGCRYRKWAYVLLYRN